LCEKSAGAVLDRIILAIGAENDSDAAKMLGVAKSTWGNWRGRNSVPYPLCVQLSEERGLSLDWLLAGEGPMSKRPAYPAAESAPPLAVAEEPPMNPRLRALIALYEELDEPSKAEIFGIAAEKKRIREIEREIAELKRHNLKRGAK
jgi:hypothetical protein